jgi:hypothetical protein
MGSTAGQTWLSVTRAAGGMRVLSVSSGAVSCFGFRCDGGCLQALRSNDSTVACRLLRAAKLVKVYQMVAHSSASLWKVGAPSCPAFGEHAERLGV